MADSTPTFRPKDYRAAVIVARDVIEWDGQPWRVESGRTTKVVRTLRLRHAHYPKRVRTVRPRRTDTVRMLWPVDHGHWTG